MIRTKKVLTLLLENLPQNNASENTLVENTANPTKTAYLIAVGSCVILLPCVTYMDILNSIPLISYCHCELLLQTL